MRRTRDKLHERQVVDWINQTGATSPFDRNRLFLLALEVVRRRTLLTLSGITVTIVIERTLQECQEKFPVLRDLTAGPMGFGIDKISENPQKLESENLQEALRELLIDLLNIFGKITADILTKYLHCELMRVQIESLEKKTFLHLELVKTKREKK